MRRRYGLFGKPSKREEALSFNAAEKFYAAAHDKEAIRQREIKPKRERWPRTVADGPSEHQLQAAVIKWWALVHHQRYTLPIEALFAIPNGGARDPITGSRLKAEGVRPGIPDLMLSVRLGNTPGLFIEMKAGKNDLSEAQTSVAQHLISQGYRYAAAWSSEEAIKIIEDYLGDYPAF
jgi:hypothetical protein